jgi:hypothetical protein
VITDPDGPGDFEHLLSRCRQLLDLHEAAEKFTKQKHGLVTGMSFDLALAPEDSEQSQAPKIRRSVLDDEP